jgi:hypothetical protein
MLLPALCAELVWADPAGFAVGRSHGGPGSQARADNWRPAQCNIWQRKWLQLYC